jgi:anti-sigma factor RsiW
MTDQSQLPEAELAALADSSLPADRRAQLRARIEASPELAAALGEQERAVRMLRALDEPAPAALRARVRELTDGAAQTRGPRRVARWRRSLFVPAATALAVAVAALVVLLGSNGSSAPTVPQTARLALAAATSPAPREDPADNDRLLLRVGGLAFPYYGLTAGWNATGARTDSIGGRQVVTVFYTAHGHRVGYAIVSGAPLPAGGGTLVTRGDVTYWLQRIRGAQVITWRQAGHTCVIAGRTVKPRTLLSLASEEEKQAAQPRS